MLAARETMSVTPLTLLSPHSPRLSPDSNPRKLLKAMVGAAGLEPATLSLEDSVSIENREHMGLRPCILAIETTENSTPTSF